MPDPLRVALIFAVSVLLSGCPEDPALLVVDVRTDLIPEVEFDAIRTEILGGGSAGVFVEHTLVPGADYVSGVQVAALEDLTRGAVTVRVSLLNDTAVVLQRPVRVTVDGSLAVTVPLYRNCLGVECPAPGGDPIAAACVAGMCANETCTEETPELCPNPGCTTDADCSGGSVCSTASCGVGGCAYAADDSLCSAGQTCDPIEGCVGEPPVPCEPFPGTDPELHALNDTTCVHAMDEPLRCWGRNAGFLGDPIGPVASVREVEPSVQLFNFALGGAHWCGVNAATGSVLCAGEDWAGQLGDGMGDSGRNTAQPIDGGIIAATLSAGFATTCAVTATATGSCWGHHDTGQLGIGTTSVEETWVPSDVMAALAWGRIDAGHQHSCGVTTGGLVYCWGSNANEQLGYATTMPGVDIPIAVPGLVGSFVSVHVGFEYSLALADDGTLWSWGANFVGQLGRPEMVGGGTFVAGPLEGEWIAVDAGYRHACGIRAGGALFCWGDDTWDQLGPNAPSRFQWEHAPVMEGVEFIHVAVGASHSCAMDATHRVWCWGDSSVSQLTGPSDPGTPNPVGVCPN